MIKKENLHEQLSKLDHVPYMANCYRLMSLKFFSDGDTPLSGNGYQYADGRFHKKDSYPVIYLAEEIQTTMDETLDYKRTSFPPKIIWSIEVRLTRMLDLTVTQNLDLLGTTIQEMTGSWRRSNNRGEHAPTQILAKAAYDSGRFEGIIYTSSKTEDEQKNIVIFKERLAATSFVKVYDPDGMVEEQLIGPTNI